MKPRNKMKGTLLALLLALSMIITYMPMSMIAYANDGSEGEAAIELSSDTDEGVTEEPAEDAVEVDEVKQDEAVDADSSDLDEEKTDGENITEVTDDSSEPSLGTPETKAEIKAGAAADIEADAEADAADEGSGQKDAKKLNAQRIPQGNLNGGTCIRGDGSSARQRKSFCGG